MMFLCGASACPLPLCSRLSRLLPSDAEKGMRFLTGFEIEGARRQYDSESAWEANRAFRNSCYLCSVKGKCIDCDDCEIQRSHRIMMNAFRDIEEERERKRKEIQRSNPAIQIIHFV